MAGINGTINSDKPKIKLTLKTCVFSMLNKLSGISPIPLAKHIADNQISDP